MNCIYFSTALSKQTSFSNSNIQLRLVKSTNPRKRTYCFFFLPIGFVFPLLRFVKMISNAIKICFNTLKCHYLESMEREKTWHLCKLTSTHEAGSTQSSRVIIFVGSYGTSQKLKSYLFIWQWKKMMRVDNREESFEVWSSFLGI